MTSDQPEMPVIVQQRTVVIDRAGGNERIHNRYDQSFAMELPTEQAGRLEEGIGHGQLAQRSQVRIQGAIRFFGGCAADEFESNEPVNCDEVLSEESLQGERGRVEIPCAQEVDPN